MSIYKNKLNTIMCGNICLIRLIDRFFILMMVIFSKVLVLYQTKQKIEKKT